MYKPLVAERVTGRLTITTQEASHGSKQRLTYPLPGRLVRLILNNLSQQVSLYEFVVLRGTRKIEQYGTPDASYPLRSGFLANLFGQQSVVYFYRLSADLLDEKAVQLSPEEEEEVRAAIPEGDEENFHDYTLGVGNRLEIIGAADMEALLGVMQRTRVHTPQEFQRVLDILADVRVSLYDQVEFVLSAADEDLLDAGVNNIYDFFVPPSEKAQQKKEKKKAKKAATQKAEEQQDAAEKTADDAQEEPTAEKLPWTPEGEAALEQAKGETVADETRIFTPADQRAVQEAAAQAETEKATAEQPEQESEQPEQPEKPLSKRAAKKARRAAKLAAEAQAAAEAEKDETEDADASTDAAQAQDQPAADAAVKAEDTAKADADIHAVDDAKKDVSKQTEDASENDKAQPIAEKKAEPSPVKPQTQAVQEETIPVQKVKPAAEIKPQNEGKKTEQPAKAAAEPAKPQPKSTKLEEGYIQEDYEDFDELDDESDDNEDWEEAQPAPAWLSKTPIERRPDSPARRMERTMQPQESGFRRFIRSFLHLIGIEEEIEEEPEDDSYEEDHVEQALRMQMQAQQTSSQPRSTVRERRRTSNPWGEENGQNGQRPAPRVEAKPIPGKPVITVVPRTPQNNAAAQDESDDQTRQVPVVRSNRWDDE